MKANSKLDYEPQLPVAKFGDDEPGYRKVGLKRGLIVVGSAWLAFILFFAWVVRAWIVSGK